MNVIATLSRFSACRFLLLIVTALPMVTQAALIDFSNFTEAERIAINGQQNTLNVGGIQVTAARSQFSPSLNIGGHSTLWIRNDPDDHGLGVCSSAASGAEDCGGTPFNPLTEGSGDQNELGNNFRDEVIRLERPAQHRWSDFWVSSLDTLSGPGHESGRFYWSDLAVPVLNSMQYITFNQSLLGWVAEQAEGSIFDYLIAHAFDVDAKFVFFRADVSNGFDNDYLVYKAGITAVPLPSAVILMSSVLFALGFIPRRLL
jgi:hypothetical protein